MRKIGIVVGAAVVFGALFFVHAASGQTSAGAVADNREEAQPDEPSPAPLNPRFLEYREAHKRGIAPRLVTAEGHALGLIPEPEDLSYLNSEPAVLSSQPIPSSYDLRTLGKVTPVKDQGTCGDCWAFGTYGSMESDLEPAETEAFSENNLKDLNGFDWSPCAGGNYAMSTAYLARWAGPVAASADPYHQTDTNTSLPDLPAQKHIQDVYVLAGRGSSTSNDTLKTAVMTYGGVGTSMYMDEDTYYKKATFAYYNTSTNGTNHSVTLVGWDDNYSASNFKATPPGDGAFLIKNSWGTSFGDAGYFWISYYDTAYARGSSSAFAGAESVANFTRQYSYDTLGKIDSYGYSSNTAWFANVFTAVEQEQLEAVSFYVASNGSPYVIKIYAGVTGKPTTGVLAGTTSGTAGFAGYHTFSLSNPVLLERGEKFSAVVELTTPSSNYPIPMSYAEEGYSSAATNSPGRSYFSSKGTSWTDVTTADPTRSICLKAFTGRAAGPVRPRRP
jgi:C1A family cysteine protease